MEKMKIQWKKVVDTSRLMAFLRQELADLPPTGCDDYETGLRDAYQVVLTMLEATPEKASCPPSGMVQPVALGKE